jgi:Serine dehydrogenase proteinase
MFEAIHAKRYLRQSLITDIEGITHRPLLVYVAGDGAQMSRNDIIGFVEMLHNIPRGSDIDLILHTPGGDIDAAEKIGILLRDHVRHLRVIVPDYAKSAGTLLATAGDEIVMGDTSELGTIDPQVFNADGRGALYSAKSYLDAFELHSKALKKDPGDVVAHLMLSKMDPVLVRKYERMTMRSQMIAVDLLQRGMLKGERKAAERVAKTLINTQKWHSHGQVITHAHALHAGLKVSYLAGTDPLWEKIWALYCQHRLVVGDPEMPKIFETNIASVHGFD